MGVIDLVKVQAKTSNQNIEEYVRYLAEVLAMTINEMDYLINGYLDAKNLKVNGIETKNLKAGAVTADKITVTELSAIAANLGHITAGLMEAVTITGSLIQTSASSYPRVELSSTATLLEAATDALNKVKIIASFVGVPSIVMTDGTKSGVVQFGPDLSTGINKTIIQSDNGVQLVCYGGDIDLLPITPGTKATVGSWNGLYNRASTRTLQQDLDAKANAFSGFSGSFSAGTQTVFVSNGIITSVV